MSLSLDARGIPLCDCDETACLRTVNDRNKATFGQKFWNCQNSGSTLGCRFYLWDDQLKKFQNSQRSVSSVPASPNKRGRSPDPYELTPQKRLAIGTEEDTDEPPPSSQSSGTASDTPQTPTRGSQIQRERASVGRSAKRLASQPPTPGSSRRKIIMPVHTAESIMAWSEDIASFAAYMQKLERHLAESEERNDKLVRENTRHKREISTLQDDIEDKEQRIAELEEEVAALKAEAENKDTEIA